MLGRIKFFFSLLQNKVASNSFVKSVMTLSAGVVVSQTVSVFTTPIISRVYSPEIIGDLSIITSYSTIVSVIVCFGLMSAIMVPKEDDEAKGLCRLLTLLVVGFTTIILLGVISVAGWWRLFDVSINYSLACIILWLYVLLINVSSVCYGYINRKKMYKVLFWNPTIGTVSNAVISIGLGLLHCGLWGYASGLLTASLIVLIHMLFHVNPYKGKIGAEYTPWRLFKKHKKFPLYQYPANIIGIFSSEMPIQLISRFYGSVVLGSYSMCMSILGIPSRFLSTPVNRVYFQEASCRFNEGKDIGEFTYRILVSNVKLAILPIVLLIIFGKPLFEFVLGDNWSQAGSFTAILGVYQLVLFCNSCLSGNYVIIGKQKINLYFAIANIVLTLSAFIVGYKMFKDIYSVLLLYSIVGSAYKLFDMGLFMFYTGVSLFRFLKFILLYIVLPAGIAVSLQLLFKEAGVL